MGLDRPNIVMVCLAGAFVAAIASPGWAQKSAHDLPATCVLEVQKKVWFNGPCTVDPGNKGSYTWNATAKSKRPATFVYLNTDSDDEHVAVGFWSGPDVRSTHAHSMISEDMKKQGDCWVGPTGRTCVTLRSK